MPAKVRDEPRTYERLFIYVGKNPAIVKKLDTLCQLQGNASRAAVVRALIERAYAHIQNDGASLNSVLPPAYWTQEKEAP